MAVTKSAKKALKRSLKNRDVNLQFKNSMKLTIKNYKKALVAGTADQAMLDSVYSIIDKTAKRNVIHKNKAARLKSQFSVKLGK